MLTSDQIDLLGESLVPLYQALERFVIQSVARRVKKMRRYTETAELQAQALRELGYSPARIQREVMKTLNADRAYRVAVAENTRAYKKALAAKIAETRAVGKADVKPLLANAGNLAFRGDVSFWRKAGKDLTRPSALSQLVQAMRRATGDELSNLTRTTAFRSPVGQLTPAAQAFTHALDTALVRVTSGADSFNSAIRDAVMELADSGLRSVDYRSGVHRQLDTAVRNCVQTAVGQLSGEISMENCRQTGVQLVEVSAHWGARTDGTGGHGDHQAWQGQVYCLNGTDGAHRNLADTTGYPDDPAGLHGYNCRHDFYPFWEGVSEPAKRPEESAPVEYRGARYTYTEATQKQRAMERTIRRDKRRVYTDQAHGNDVSVPLSQIESRKDEYQRFSDATALRPKWERTMVEGEGAADWKRIFKKTEQEGQRS